MLEHETSPVLSRFRLRTKLTRTLSLTGPRHQGNFVPAAPHSPLLDSRHQAGGVFAECQGGLTFLSWSGTTSPLSHAHLSPSVPSATGASMYHPLLSTATPLPLSPSPSTASSNNRRTSPVRPCDRDFRFNVLDLSCLLADPLFLMLGFPLSFNYCKLHASPCVKQNLTTLLSFFWSVHISLR